MGIDHGEGRRLALQGGQDRDQRQMLGHIGEVPGMEGVAIVHGRFMMNNSVNRAILKTGGGMAENSARIAVAAVLVAGLALTLALSWPGHLSYDSIVQLHDGRLGFYHSWHPPVMAWMLGLGDAVLPGAGLFVLFVFTLAFAAWLSLLWIVKRPSWLAVCVAAVCVLLPQLVLYQAIVWKDVLFADAAMAGFPNLPLAQAEARQGRTLKRASGLDRRLGAFALFALASLTRQNGFDRSSGGEALALGIARGAPRGVWKFGALLAGIGGARGVPGGGRMRRRPACTQRSVHGEGTGPLPFKLLRLYDLTGAGRIRSVAAARPVGRGRCRRGWKTLIRTDGVRLYSPHAQRHARGLAGAAERACGYAARAHGGAMVRSRSSPSLALSKKSAPMSFAG